MATGELDLDCLPLLHQLIDEALGRSKNDGNRTLCGRSGYLVFLMQSTKQTDPGPGMEYLWCSNLITFLLGTRKTTQDDSFSFPCYEFICTVVPLFSPHFG